MTTQPNARADGREDPHLRRARRIEAFHSIYRHALHSLSVDAPALEDLADSFPALLFALASGYGTARARNKTIRAIESGAPLREAAAGLGLPWWLRKLPPATFTQSIGALPSGPGYDARLAQLAPAAPSMASAWLNRISYANDACHEDFALWVARQHRFNAPAASHEMFLYLTAWAWHAGQSDTLGHRILRKPWTPAMGLRRASDEMAIWRRRIAMVACLGSGVADSWIREGRVRGYDFVALRSVEDFIGESLAMDNCLDQYAEHLDNGVTRIFSIRKNGKPVADVEIGPHEEEPRMPALLQLRGPRNRRASPEIWQAAFAWLGSKPVRLLPAEHGRHRALARRREARKAFWQPYLVSLKGTGHEERFKLLALGGAKQRAARARRERADPFAAALRDAAGRLALANT